LVGIENYLCAIRRRSIGVVVYSHDDVASRDDIKRPASRAHDKPKSVLRRLYANGIAAELLSHIAGFGLRQQRLRKKYYPRDRE
jgi:hypothetical protein